MIEEKARQFAEAAHAGIDHRRKYTREPYIAHPAAVVELVRSVPHTKAMIAAAWLHDVVEDTPVTLAEVEREFGQEIAVLVEALTDVSRLEDGNRKKRKAIDREHTANAPSAAKTIKLADLIDNTSSITAHDPDFAKVYLVEKALLLDVLRDGDSTLWGRAAVALVKAQTLLRYGCHCDLEPGMQPDGCVLEGGGHCTYAKPGMRKEQCEYWKIIT